MCIWRLADGRVARDQRERLLSFKEETRGFREKIYRIALWVALISSLGQLLSGHTSAQIAAEYQPAKLAAFEGHYEAKAPRTCISSDGSMRKEKRSSMGFVCRGC